MKCHLCNSEFKKTSPNSKYCSDECRRLKVNKQVLEYYYRNKKKVLEYQTKYLSEKMINNKEFRSKRLFRNKSRKLIGPKRLSELIGESCVKCGSTKDLHRHHPNYKCLNYVILCRKCHNDLHQEIKKRHKSQMPIFIKNLVP